MGVPAVAFVGKSGSGKTTVCEKVIAALAERGLRVGAVKYFGTHDFEVDRPGKDSWRFAKAGACDVAICSDSKLVLQKTLDKPAEQVQVAEMMDDVDVLVFEAHRICEGVPAVLVLRSAASSFEASLAAFDPAGLVAVATDDVRASALAESHGLAVFDLDDVEGIAGLIKGLRRA